MSQTEMKELKRIQALDAQQLRKEFDKASLDKEVPKRKIREIERKYEARINALMAERDKELAPVKKELEAKADHWATLYYFEKVAGPGARFADDKDHASVAAAGGKP